MEEIGKRDGGRGVRSGRGRATVVGAVGASLLGLMFFGCASSDDKRPEGNVGALSQALNGTSDAVPCNAWSRAIVANTGTVMLNAQSRVDSYRSAAGGYGGSNVGEGAIVQAATSIANNGAIVKGQLVTSTPGGFAVVPVPSSAIKLPLGSATPGSLNINTAAESITLAPGDYVAANINVNFAGSIKVAPAGQVRIWVTGSLSLGGVENLNGTPRNLAFLVTGAQDVNVNSNGSLYGLIYAPNAKVNIESKIFGSVVGKSVTVNSTGVVHFDTSSTTRDAKCSGHGACPAPASTLTCSCDPGWMGADCNTPSAPPTPPRKLPKPPSQPGCYWYTLNGWEAIPCEPVADVIAEVGKPVLPPSLSTPHVETTPNPTTSTVKPLVAPPGGPTLPVVFAQAEMLFPAVAGVTDVIPNPPDPFPGCAQTGTPDANQFSAQLNTNKFVMANGHNGAVQFVIQTQGLNKNVHICAWQVDVTDQTYDDSSVCIKAPPASRDTPLRAFDNINIQGSVDPVAKTMGIVVQLSWVKPGSPNIYATVGADKYGLAGNWFQFDAAVLGIGDCSQTQFTDTSVVTRMMGSTCVGVTGPGSSTSGCSPSLKIEPSSVKFENRSATAETNNLIQLGTPAVSYPNPWLAVTNVTQTTSGSCIDPKHVYVRDYALDNGSVPSNAAGQAFWESPDIFLVPQGTPVDENSTPAQSLITPNSDYDVYVRVHNDLGCAPVNGAKALVYIADPSALSTAWNPLTGGEYRAATTAGNVVPAGGKSLIGPFPYHAPATGFGDGHKCLIAAVSAEGENGVTNFFDAPSSNQVAQRNVQLEDCAFPLTNTTGTNGKVEVTLSVSPPEAPPSLSAFPEVSVVFDDAASAWYNVWVAQPQNGTAYVVSRTADNKTRVRLGKASITLPAVDLNNGESRTARGSFALANAAPLLTLAMQASLKNPSNGGQLAPVNGGSCQAKGAIVQ